jgi:hypothetical protein
MLYEFNLVSMPIGCIGDHSQGADDQVRLPRRVATVGWPGPWAAFIDGQRPLA